MEMIKAIWARFLTLKVWQKLFVVFITYVIFASVTGFGSASESPKSSTESTSSIQERSYPVEYLSHADVNPASVSVRFGIKNDGTQPITPTCKIKMSDSSGTYSGYDFFDITDPIAPAQTKQVVVQLTITNEGAAYVDTFTGTCTAETSDTGTTAGQDVVITDIENMSATDGSEGWYWQASFKANQPFMTQMDCVVKALDKNGKVVDEVSFRGNTLNGGYVTAYGQNERSDVDASKSVVLSIKSFDVKCTL